MAKPDATPPIVDHSKRRRTRGLGTVRQRARDGAWEGRVSWIVGGKRHYRSVIRKTKREAATALADLRKKYQPGSLARNTDVSFDAFMRSWLAAQQRQWTPGTYRTQSIYVEKHILGVHSTMGRLMLRDVTADHIDAFLVALKDASVGVQTRASVRRTITTALNFAMSKGKVASNAAASAEKVRVPTRSGRKSLSLTQVRALLKVAKTKPQGSLITFLLDTGCRLSEAFALSWDDVNLEDGWVDLKKSLSKDAKNRSIRKATKTGIERRVYLEEDTLRLLQAHVTHRSAWEHLVWSTDDGKPLDKDRFRKRVAYPIFKEAKLPEGFVVHSLRHTAASIHLAKGTDILTVQKRGGWADTRMLLTIYGHAQEDAQKTAVAKIGAEKRGYRTLKALGKEYRVPTDEF